MKQNLSEIMDDIFRKGYIEADVVKLFKKRRYELWMKLISSDWFTMFLKFLNLKEIVKLDTSFCNHDDRPFWLNLLRKSELNITITNDGKTEKSTHWLLIKNISPHEISFNRHFNSSTIFITDSSMLKLTRNCPNLKSLEIRNNLTNYSFTLNGKLLSYIGAYCRNLESIDIQNVNIPGNHLEIVAKTLLQLTSISIKNSSHIGLDKLIMANKNLQELHISNMNNFPFCDVLNIVGQHCPLLTKCQISQCVSAAEVTNAQIETFSNGCPILKYLELWLPKTTLSNIIDHLFRCLSQHTKLLETLIVIRNNGTERDYFAPDSSNDSHHMKIYLSESILSLCNECTLLRKIAFHNCDISAQGITYLINNATQLDSLILKSCDIPASADDILCITKETRKLQHLKVLDILLCPNISDLSIMNIVKNCQKLEYIHIDKLTDDSLFVIAEYCPNLQTINFKFDGVKTTIVGLVELLKKCPKLTDMGDSDIPSEIKEELRLRDIGNGYNVGVITTITSPSSSGQIGIKRNVGLGLGMTPRN